MKKKHEFSVLIVDDDDEHQKNFTRWLQRKKMTVLNASDGLNALGILKPLRDEKLPDCIILDVNMPRMDGFEFCSRLKTDKTYSHANDIPILMLTARTSDETRDKAFDFGVDLFLRKTEIRGADSLTTPVLNLCQRHQTAKQGLIDFETMRHKANQVLKTAKIKEKSMGVVLYCLELLPYPGDEKFAELIHYTLRKKFGIEGAVCLQSRGGPPTCYTERSDLFKDILQRFTTSGVEEQKETGVFHKPGYTIVVTDQIISMGIGYPKDDFSKRILGDIIAGAHQEFEAYLEKKQSE